MVSDAPTGTAASVMAVLAWLPRLLVAHLVWIALTLLGGVVLGVAPATVTVLHMLEQETRGRRDGLRGLLRIFRRELVPANLAVGPFWLIAAAAGANILAVTVGSAPVWFVPTGAAAAVLLGVLGLVAGHHAASLRVLMPTAPLPTLWKAGLAGPVAIPLATAAWLITILALAAAVVVMPVVGLVVGAGAVTAVTWVLMLRIWREKLPASDRAAVP